jgi:hypothetical protein
MNTEYKQKYLKYKQKYLILKGGLINQIKTEDLPNTKESYTVPEKLKHYIELITIKNTKFYRLGTSSFKLQPYFGDIDINNVVEKNMTTEELVKSFVNELQINIKKIIDDKKIFFSDFKAGDLHWLSEEVLAGVKDGKKLEDCVKQKGVVKLDIIAPYNERYVEITSFFILKSNEGYINIDANFFDMFQSMVMEDINKYKHEKPFKALKRVWSLARNKKDLQTLDKLKNIIKSNLSLLSQINADIETLKLLIEHGSNYDVQFVINQIDKFKDLIAGILDIKIDEKAIYAMVENIITQLKSSDPNKEKLVEALDIMHDYLLEIINKETKEYIKEIDFHFPGDKISILEKIKHFFTK